MMVEKGKKEGEESECAAIHIRRTDVVLHGAQARKYFAVEEYYLKELKEHNLTHMIKDILLEFHPEYNWMYLKKKRHRGSEGGWENQIPGDSPAEEMVAVQAIFKTASDKNNLTSDGTRVVLILIKSKRGPSYTLSVPNSHLM